MTNRNWLGRATITGAALVLIAAMAFTACSKKEGGSGGSAGAVKGLTETPASDFSFDLTSDGQGIVIKGYTGNGGVVRIPATIEDIPVKEIGMFALRGVFRGDINPANAITEVILPASVTIIDQFAFENMENLTKVTFSDGLQEIRFRAFRDCSELNNLVFPDSISSIKFGSDDVSLVFEGCKKLPIATRQKLQELGYKSTF